MVCRNAKQIIPPTRMRTALTAVRRVDVLDSLKLPINPMLKNSRRAPKMIPLIPASDSNRLIVRE